MFTKSQISFMRNNGINIDFDKKLSDSDYIEIEEKVSHLLQIQGFDEKYVPTQIGLMCEEIIDSIE